jgi:NAD(P)-dependent dehydrogenase (short-subunit alcohol dehydrogenase family)
MDIKGVAAVVTGAASGLGEATARALAARGAKVAVFDRDAERGNKVAGEIGGIFCEVDVTSDEKVAAAFAKARGAHGQERILVNCAGIANAAKTVARDKETKAAKLYPMQQFELAIQINLIGTFRNIAHSALGMVDLEPLADGEKGVIINTASVAAEDGQIGQAAYSASKGGVLAMGRAGAVSEAPRPTGRICRARLLPHREPVHERSLSAARRRNPDGAALSINYGVLIDELAIAAREAGEAILQIVRHGFEVESKQDTSPVTAPRAHAASQLANA